MIYDNGARAQNLTNHRNDKNPSMRVVGHSVSHSARVPRASD
jgi:hypothetical protein